MRQLQSLGLDPPKRLQILEKEIILWHFRRQLDRVVVAALRCPGNSLEKLVNSTKKLYFFEVAP